VVNPIGSALSGAGGLSGPGNIGGAVSGAQAASETQQAGGGFQAVLDSLGQVQQGADSALTDLSVNGDAELHDVVLAVESESLAFELAVQIRNRMVDAYQEIFRMSV